MQPRLLILPAALLLAAGASAQTNPLFISDNVMTGLTWHAAKTPGDGSSGSCALTAGVVQYYSAPFFTDQTADTYSLHVQYPSYQAGYAYLYQDEFDPTDPCAGIFEFGLAPVVDIYDIHLEAGRQYVFVTSEAALFGGGGAFQVLIEGPPGSLLTLGTTGPCSAHASDETYGEGKPGTLGVPILSSPLTPSLGTTVGLALWGGLPGAGPVLFAGGSQPAKLPFEGGSLLVMPSFTFGVHSLDSSGMAMVSAALPDDPSLCGAELFFQAAFVDPGAGGRLHLALTTGVHWALGN